MFDINICMAVSTVSKFRQRILDFSVHGLRRTEKYSISLTLLSGPSDDVKFLRSLNFPVSIVNIIEMPFDDHARKIYSYFSSISEKTIEESKWFAVVDDDSMTDCKTLLNYIDRKYKWEQPVYLMANVGHFILEKYINILDDMYLLDIFEIPGFSKTHLFSVTEECGILSQKALQIIRKDSICFDILKRATFFDGGLADQCIGLCCEILRIPAFNCPIMTHLPLIKDFSWFGGRLAHIHFIAHDKKEWKEYLQLCSKFETDGFVYEFDAKNDVYRFAKQYDTYWTLISPCLVLGKNGEVFGHYNKNEYRWEKKEGQLIFYNADGKESSILEDVNKDGSCYRGKLISNPLITHWLRRVYA